jgi:hypothetical protein
MKTTPRIFLMLIPLCITSCAEIGESLIDSMFQTRHDREIDSDTERMLDGKPLKHFPSERRLRLAREDRMISDMMDD